MKNDKYDSARVVLKNLQKNFASSGWNVQMSNELENYITIFEKQEMGLENRVKLLWNLRRKSLRESP